VPIVIHLLNRRRFHRVPWAAMEYLLAAMKRNRKRLRMEQWLVLLLRTLAVVMLALLVARPQLSGGSLIGTVTHHVVLLDDTASMQQRSGSLALWDKAKDQVRELANRLASTRGGDLFSLVRTTAPAQPELWAQRIGPELGQRVGALVGELQPSNGTMDLGSTLHDAHVRATAMKEAGHTDYYLIGDVRAVDWISDDDKARPSLVQALAQLDATAEHLTALAVGSRDADNLAITAIRRVDRLATAGVPIELAVDVMNLGLDATPATELAVEMDGKSRVVRPLIALAPGEATTVVVQHTFHGAGDHRVEASFPPVDHYLVDDRRALALPVQARSRVLLVDGEPESGEDEEGGETMFLQVALDPGGEAPSGIEVQVVTESALPEVDLEPFDMVWLCNVPVPNRTMVEKLERFVARGAGLAIFVGAQVDPVRYDDAMWRGGQGLLPLPLGEIDGDPDRREHLVVVDRQHPICGPLGDVIAVLCNATVLVKRYLKIQEPPQNGASVLARIRDSEGSPAIVTRTFGSGGGAVVLFGISADKHWSNWPDTDVNVVFAQQVHRYAARARDLGPVNLTTSGVLRFDLDPGVYKADVAVHAMGGDGDERTVTAVEPKGSASPQPPDDRAPERGNGEPRLLQLTLPMAELRQFGAYEATLQLHAGATETRVFTRSADATESHLVRLQATDFARVYPPEVHDRVTFRDDASGFAASTGEGELWRLLAAAMLAALLLETLLAWRFGRR
jgi:hypothetical protein